MVRQARQDLVSEFGLAPSGATEIEHHRLHPPEIRKGQVELACRVRVRERRDVHDGDPAGQCIRGERRRVERPAIVERQAARHAQPTRLAARHANEEMEGCALLTLEHPGHGPEPAIHRSGPGGLGQHRVPNPRFRGDSLDGDDLGEPGGPGDAHLVVLRVVDDERPSLDALEQQRRARDARSQVRRGDDGGLAVGKQGQQTPQPAVEQQVGLRLGGEPQVRRERRIPVRADAVPVRVVVARLGPDGGDRHGALGGAELLAGQRVRQQRGRGQP